MELIRPNLQDNETLSLDERLEAVTQYMGNLAVLGAQVHQEFYWAQQTKLRIRAEQLGIDPSRVGLV